MTETTLLSLLNMFISYLQEKRYQTDEQRVADLEGFKEFVKANDQHSLIALLDRNAGVSVGIKAMLHKDHDLIFKQLDSIESMLATLCQGIEGVGEVAQAIHPDAHISRLAKEILQRFTEGHAEFMLRSLHSDGETLIFAGASAGNMELDSNDRRFISDDLDTLVELRLLKRGFTNKGADKYSLTRAGDEFWRRITDRS